MEIQMKMPDLATTGSDIRLIRWLANPGQPIKRGQPLFEIETDKAISQVESIATGILKEMRASPDALVSVGQVIAAFEITAQKPGKAVEEASLHPTAQAPAAAFTKYK